MVEPAVKRLKKTLASIDSGPKKKSYKKNKKDSNLENADQTRMIELAEYASIDEIDDILDGYHETQTPIPSDMLHDIHTTCSELMAELGENNLPENRIFNIRKRTQQVQRIARKMRSI